jgi:DDE family transposase
LGFGELIERHLADVRGKNAQLPLADLVRQSVYSRLAGYEDVNDAERLSQDPAFRLIGSEKVSERGPALTSRLQSFETELLTQAENLAGLAVLNRELVAKGETIASPRRVVLDIWTAPRSRSKADRSTAPTTGTSSPPAITRCCCSIAKATAWRRNCALGNVHSAEGWQELLLPEIERQQRQGKEKAVWSTRRVEIGGKTEILVYGCMDLVPMPGWSEF